MSESFDTICRTLASPIPRRQALKLVGSILLGAALAFLGPAKAHGQEEIGCCQRTPDTCFDGPRNPNQEFCEVDGGTWNPGVECFAGFRCETRFCSLEGQVCDPDLPCCPGLRCNVFGSCVLDSTAIELISFTAETVDNGTVTLTWETATEVDNAGFNLYRASTTGGPYMQINHALIPAQGDPVAGASYSFKDSSGPGTFRYILTDVDTSGRVTLHGPVRVKVAKE